MLVIMLNCVTLGMFRPCEDVECRSERCGILEVGGVGGGAWRWAGSEGGVGCGRSLEGGRGRGRSPAARAV